MKGQNIERNHHNHLVFIYSARWDYIYVAEFIPARGEATVVSYLSWIYRVQGIVNKLEILPFYVMSRPNDHCFV